MPSSLSYSSSFEPGYDRSIRHKSNISFTDRFINARKPSSVDNFHASLALRRMKAGGKDTRPKDHASAVYESRLRAVLNVDPDANILTYGTKAPLPIHETLHMNRNMFSQNKLFGIAALEPEKTNLRNARAIPKTAEKILDAPDYADDYYLNLLAYHTTQNIIAIGLGSAVYLWEADTSKISKLVDYADDCSSDSAEAYVCSVEWMKAGHCLAIGNSRGETQIWDCTRMKKLRNMKGHADRVGTLAWDRYTLSSGSKSGQIINFDVRSKEPIIALLEGHSQEVCGLTYSESTGQLASGGNDNLVCIWDQNMMTSPKQIDPSGKLVPQNSYSLSAQPAKTPLFTFSQHKAAVKALDWCPWSDHLLCSGGGTADRTIKFWNTKTGSLINSVDTQSQVSSLIWSKTSKELVSAHGYSQNQISIWKYPTMSKTTDLFGHSARILSMALSPDGQTIVSAAGDETLRFWKCFDPIIDDNQKIKDYHSYDPFSSANLNSHHHHIR